MTPHELQWETFPHVEPPPGNNAKNDAAYGAFPQPNRNYWESGDNGSLKPAQREKLEDQAWKAARFRGTGRYDADLPRNEDGSVDHGQLVRQVKEYADAALTPNGDRGGAAPAPKRPLGGIIDLGTTPEGWVPPPDQEHTTMPGWVCINHAVYAAALLRALGYPVREINVALTQTGAFKGGNRYQEAALQVWFDGSWHYFDPYLCYYAPEETIGAYGDYSDFHTFYWDGTSPPDNWGPPRGDNPGGWRPLSDREVGADLQRRFYPQSREGLGDQITPHETSRERRLVLTPDRSYRPVSHAMDNAEGTRSGVGIRTQTSDVRLSLADEQGRIASIGRLDLPGAIHLPAGLRVPYSKELSQETGSAGESEGSYYDEAVFFGTVGLFAEYEEIGEHRLTLRLVGKPTTTVTLEVAVIEGKHPIRVTGLSETVDLDASGVASLSFNVTILPYDASTHVQWEALISKNVVETADYRVAMEKLAAINAGTRQAQR